MRLTSIRFPDDLTLGNEYIAAVNFMDATRLLSVAKDFSQFPAGRSVSDGPRSGEEFCDKHLVPALHACEHVTVEMDGTMGYGSSWLEGAFARLVRHHRFTAAELRRRMTVQYVNDPSIEDEVWMYIDGK